MFKKGVTPIIAIIIILLITVALAGLAWSYLQGIVSTQVTDTFLVPTGGIYCDSNGTHANITVLVTNTGYQSFLDASDFIILQIDGYDISDRIDPSFSIGPGNTSRLINRLGCNNSANGITCNSVSSPSGIHTVDLGTGATVLHPTVTCP